MSRNLLLVVTLVAFCQPGLSPATEETSTPGELRTDSTPNAISIEWDLTGDDDHDAICNVEYRQQGSDKWLEALPLLRVDYQWWYHTQRADKPVNMLAGSLMFLKPDTTYEVRFDLADPDGGKATKMVSVPTRPVPKLPQNGRMLHVVPGSGGGSGTIDDPFRGLAAAQDAAKAGDVFLLHKGDYGRFAFEKSGDFGKYIVWKSAGNGEAVFSGIRVAASHLWFDGLHLKRKDESNGLRASDNASDVVVRDCRFDGFHYSITLKPTSRYWHITDNLIVGDNDPVTGGIGGEGVELNHSCGHVVAYNDISGVADGVSCPERNCDIYGNDIHDVSDDGLEPDYGKANVRMWSNRIYNYHFNALSFQPMKCGPWYFVRNIRVGTGGTFKLRVQDRFALINNTFVTWGSIGNRMHHILTSYSRNNLYISADGEGPIWTAHDCNQPQYCLPNNNRQRFKDLQSFAEAVGIEKHGVRVRKEEIFVNWSIPAEPARVSPQHLTLKAGSEAVDAGAVVPNSSNDFVGKAPDLGAYEFGGEMPHYGPRSQ